MRLHALRILGLGFVVCALGLSVAATPATNKITGVVVDPTGTPQMGATVVISSEQLGGGSPLEIHTNDRGRFSTVTLPAGLYSIRVTLAGFLPAIEQHVEVNSEHSTLLEIVLGSVFSPFETQKRGQEQPVNTDDWTWVLRTSAATRPVMRWQDDQSTSDAGNVVYSTDASNEPALRARLVLASGADHPGSIGDSADSPSTSFGYDIGLGSKGQFVLAGQYSEENGSSSGGFAGEWLPTGQLGAGPVTTILVRESRLAPGGPTFRGVRLSHEDELALGDMVSIRYGADYVMAGFNGSTQALRPRAEVAVQISPTWRADAIVATHPWQDPTSGTDAMQAAFNTLDAFPTLLLRDGHPVLEDGLHEELAFDHVLSPHADLIASVFHDLSSHTAVIGRDGPSGNPDFLQDYFSEAFAYDGGSTSSGGARLVYRDKINSNLTTTVVYAYAGALAPNGIVSAELRNELATRYRQSVAGAITTNVPKLHTKVTTSYKWLSGTTVSRQDPYGESLYHLDPYLSLEIRQPLPNCFPGHMEVQADLGNLLAQGYVPIASNDGSVVLVPAYRYFRGGLSLQF